MKTALRVGVAIALVGIFSSEAFAQITKFDFSTGYPTYPATVPNMSYAQMEWTIDSGYTFQKLETWSYRVVSGSDLFNGYQNDAMDPGNPRKVGFSIGVAGDYRWKSKLTVRNNMTMQDTSMEINSPKTKVP